MRTEVDTCLDNRSEYRITTAKKILSMTQAFSIRTHNNELTNNERHYPFKFDVQSWMRHDQERNQQHSALATRSNFAALPPSLRHEIYKTPNGVPKPRAGARVSYRLTARLSKGRKVIGRAAQPILLLLSQDPSPPMCIADFKGEYRPFQTAVLKGSLFSKLGDISVIVQEPRPMSVKAKSENSMVEVPIRLRIDRPHGEIAVPETLSVEAEVKWAFRFSTFVSMLEQRGPVTLSQAMVSPATACVRSTLRTRTMRMSWRKWQQTARKEECTRLESEQSLWLSLARDEVLTPTFWTPVLSRRYSIVISVKVSSPGTAKLEVEVPIQVGIEAGATPSYEEAIRSGRDRTDNALLERMDGDELLPRYVR